MSTIRWLHSEMLGSPGRLGGATGAGFPAFQSIFDAFLVNGFAAQSPTSVVVDSGVCTATFSSANLFPAFSVVRVSGADVPQVNGDFVVLSTPGNAITFSTPGAPNGSVGGSITIRLAPLGWSNPFSTSTSTVYKPYDPDNVTTYFYRIDSESADYYLAMRLVANATSTTSGTVLQSFRQYFSSYSTLSPWLVIGNGKTFYMLNAASQHARIDNGFISVFGAAAPVFNGDQFFWVHSKIELYGSSSANNPEYNIEYCGPFNSDSSLIVAARSSNGASVAQPLSRAMESLYPGSPGLSGAFTPGVAFPNAGNLSLILSRQALFANSSFRGVLPGVYVSPQNCAQFYSHLQIIDGTGTLSGRKLLAVRCGNTLNTTGPGVVFFDITGPWSYTP